MSITTRLDLADLGCLRVSEFCWVNKILVPTVRVVPLDDWHVDACAYYRSNTESNRKWTKPGIDICLERCASPATEHQVRNWNWPGSTTDREPFGVLCHELGHHCDWIAGV